MTVRAQGWYRDTVHARHHRFWNGVVWGPLTPTLVERPPAVADEPSERLLRPFDGGAEEGTAAGGSWCGPAGVSGTT